MKRITIQRLHSFLWLWRYKFIAESEIMGEIEDESKLSQL